MKRSQHLLVRLFHKRAQSFLNQKCESETADGNANYIVLALLFMTHSHLQITLAGGFFRPWLNKKQLRLSSFFFFFLIFCFMEICFKLRTIYIGNWKQELIRANVLHSSLWVACQSFSSKISVKTLEITILHLFKKAPKTSS